VRPLCLEYTSDRLPKGGLIATSGYHSRPWQEVAKELIAATDPEMIWILSVELTHALREGGQAEEPTQDSN
jgi:hypothetical protein